MKVTHVDALIEAGGDPKVIGRSNYAFGIGKSAIVLEITKVVEVLT